MVVKLLADIKMAKLQKVLTELELNKAPAANKSFTHLSEEKVNKISELNLSTKYKGIKGNRSQ